VSAPSTSRASRGWPIVRRSPGRACTLPATADSVRGRAAAALAAVGLRAPTGPATVTDDNSTGGWVLSWDRTEGGIPVRGDGTTVVAWPDGAVVSVSQRAHALAASRTARMTSADAARLAQACLLPAGSAAGVWTVGSPDLEWVSPNGAFGGPHPVGGEAEYRLAWVVTATSASPDASLRAVTVYLDAGTGELLGGDVVE
jgi:hypothetical protein